jgi:PadR family transcriptional regulator PadR
MSIQVAGVLLDGCVLSFLSRGDTYGYILTRDIKEMLDVSESTLYPVMRRLQTDECLSVYDVAYNGRNRRYYKITQRGENRLRECISSWQEFKQKVDSIFHGGVLQ